MSTASQTLDLSIYRRGIYLRTLSFPVGQRINLGGSHGGIAAGLPRLAATIEVSPKGEITLYPKPNAETTIKIHRLTSPEGNPVETTIKAARPTTLEHGDRLTVNFGWEVQVVGVPSHQTQKTVSFADYSALRSQLWGVVNAFGMDMGASNDFIGIARAKAAEIKEQETRLRQCIDNLRGHWETATVREESLDKECKTLREKLRESSDILWGRWEKEFQRAECLRSELETYQRVILEIAKAAHELGFIDKSVVEATTPTALRELGLELVKASSTSRSRSSPVSWLSYKGAAMAIFLAAHDVGVSEGGKEELTPERLRDVGLDLVERLRAVRQIAEELLSTTRDKNP